MRTKNRTKTSYALNVDTWVKMFQPRDNLSGNECGLTIVDRSTIIFDYRNTDDLKEITAAHPSTVWTVVEGDSGDWFIVNGLHRVNREGYLITRIGLEEGYIEVPLRTDNDDDDLGFSPNHEEIIVCEHGCQSVSGDPVLVYIFEDRFSHYYCRHCSSTCT